MSNDRSYAKEYTQAMSGYNVPYQYLANPYILNEVLKNVNMNPAGQDRDNLIKMVQDPKSNEKKLRRFAQYLYNVQTPFKRLVHYYADMLTFDIAVYPVNATEKDMKTDEFKKQYNKIWKDLSKFEYKKEFKNILIGMMTEDAKFMYLRDEDPNRTTLQEMPVDYCIIDSRFPYGWLYSFDLNYFNIQGVDINSFATEFKEYYANWMNLMNGAIDYAPNIRPELRDGRWTYLQQINPKRSWVFKFHDIFAGLVPPLLGLFVDANEIDNFKQLQTTKTALDVYNLLIGLIPVNKNKNSSKHDDLAISAELAGAFNALVNQQLPDGVKFGTVPFDDVKQFDFSKNAQTRDDIVGDAITNFYKTGGTDQALFNADKPNATTMGASTLVDGEFIKSVYGVFEAFLNYQLIKKFDKYKFKIKFSGTMFDKEKRKEDAMKMAEYGIITPDLPASLGMTEKEMRDGISLMQALGYPSNLQPVPTSHTMPNEEEVGRNELDANKKTEKGEEASDNKTNDDK